MPTFLSELVEIYKGRVRDLRLFGKLTTTTIFDVTFALAAKRNREQISKASV